MQGAGLEVGQLGHKPAPYGMLVLQGAGLACSGTTQALYIKVFQILENLREVQWEVGYHLAPVPVSTLQLALYVLKITVLWKIVQ